MERPPRGQREGVFAQGIGSRILLQGIFIEVIALGGYWLALRWGYPRAAAQTVAFLTMAFSQLVHTLNVKTWRTSVFAVGLGNNRALIWALLVSGLLQLVVVVVRTLQNLLGTMVLPGRSWHRVAGLSLLPLVTGELAKAVASD